MSDKELYQQKLQAQLDEWKAEVDKLQAKASEASAAAQLEINEHISALESEIDEGRAKLAEVAAMGEEAWESVKEGVESSWGALKSTFSEVISRLRA